MPLYPANLRLIEHNICAWNPFSADSIIAAKRICSMRESALRIRILCFVCFIVIAPPALLSCTAATAQTIVPAKVGIISLMQGKVYVDNQAIENVEKDLPLVGNGQTLRTEQGRAEVLLSAGIYFRLDENSSMQMVNNLFNDTRVTLEKGSALIEVIKKPRGNQVKVGFWTYLIDIGGPGLYRIDAESRELRVYGGSAQVTRGQIKIGAKKGGSVYLDEDPAKSNFDADVADSFHRWAARRSFDLFDADQNSRKQPHWVPVSSGWVLSSNYRMLFYSEIFAAEYKSRMERGVMGVPAGAGLSQQAIRDRAAAQAAALAAGAAAHPPSPPNIPQPPR
jgi:hypothetical protein